MCMHVGVHVCTVGPTGLGQGGHVHTCPMFLLRGPVMQEAEGRVGVEAACPRQATLQGSQASPETISG